MTRQQTFSQRPGHLRMTENDSAFDIIIEPEKSTSDFIRELVKFRELFFFMAWRDILVRYKQTAIGVAWSVIRPLMSMIVFTVIFGNVAKLPSGGIPYPVMVFSALLPWQFFANSMQSASESLIRSGSMISKVYFPRVILPASAVIVSTIDFAISFAVLCILMMICSFTPSAMMIFIPLFFVPAAMSALGAGFLFSALGVKYHDFRHIMPFILQAGLFVSPVGFSSSVIPQRWRMIYSLNPMAGVIDGFRWCISGEGLYVPGAIISVISSAVIFVIGLKYFRKTEKFFADYI